MLHFNPATPSPERPRRTFIVCRCPSSPCRGESPLEWQFMQRRCRSTGTIASNAAADATSSRATVPVECCFTFCCATAWSVRWQIRPHVANASISANVSLCGLIYFLLALSHPVVYVPGAKRRTHALSGKRDFTQSDACRIKDRIAQSCGRQGDGGFARAGGRI